MILAYNIQNIENDDSNDNYNFSDVSSIKKGNFLNINDILDESHSSSTLNKDLNTDNIFVFDVKYSDMFMKNKKQNDEMFFEKFEDLKIKNLIKNGLKADISYSHDDCEVSAKEENFFNADFLKLINSPRVV
jgi:hypothetical protein